MKGGEGVQGMDQGTDQQHSEITLSLKLILLSLRTLKIFFLYEIQLNENQISI